MAVIRTTETFCIEKTASGMLVPTERCSIELVVSGLVRDAENIEIFPVAGA